MKFYDCETAPSPRRVRILMAEKGIDIETVQIDLRSGEQFSEDFQKISPDCVVPALRLDDGSCLTEVLAISYYLESKYPEPSLFGTSDEERGRILMWNTKAEQQCLFAVAEAFRNTAKGMTDRALTGPQNYAQIPQLAERGRDRVVNFFNRLDRQLADNEFVAGDRFSIADITAWVAADFAAWIKLSVPDDAVHMRRWHAAMLSRASANA